MGRSTSIKTTTTDNFTQLVDNINNQSIDVGATGKLTTTVDSDIVGAINELDSNMGAKTSLTTTNKTSIVNAINELDSDLGQLSILSSDIRDSNFAVSINKLNTNVSQLLGSLSGLDSAGGDSDTRRGGFDVAEQVTVVSALNTLSQDIQKLDSDINREARMTTTATTLRGAINELDSDIGARPHTSLNTTAKNLVDAINENKASLNALAVFRNIATDSGSGSISVTVDSANDTLSILSGGSLKTTGFNNTIQIDHDVTGASSVNNSGNTFIQDLTIDAHGHVTGTASATAPAPNNLVNSNISSSAAIEFSKMEDLTTSRALVSDGNGDVSASAVTSTELGYVDGVTSAIQTQLDAKTTLAAVAAMVYPVGSVYLNYSSSTNPATLFGVGSWSLMYDRVIVGAGSSYGLNTTGGATTSSGSTSFTIASGNLPNHNHLWHKFSSSSFSTSYLDFEYAGRRGKTYTSTGAERFLTPVDYDNNQDWDTGDKYTSNPSYNSTNTPSAISISISSSTIQPYWAVYMWYRSS